MTQFIASLAEHPTEPVVGVAAPDTSGRIIGKTGVGTAGIGGYLREGNDFRSSPISRRATYHGGTVAGSRLHLLKLDEHDSFTSGYLNGGSVRAYRYTGGIVVEHGPYGITNCHIRVVTTITPDGAYTPNTTYEWSGGYYFADSTTVYFAVATIDANGNQSEWSTVASGTSSANHSEVSVDNTTSSSPAVTGTMDNGITAPTGLVITTEDSGRRFVLNWNAVGGATGYVCARSDHADFTHEQYLDLAGSPSLQNDDLFVVEKDWGDGSGTAEAIFSNRLRKAPLGVAPTPGHRGNPTPDPAGLSWVWMVEDSVPFVRFTNNSAGPLGLTGVHTGNADQTWYSVLEPGVSYKSRVKARSALPATLTYDMAYVDHLSNTSFALTTDWAEYDSTFSRDTVWDGGFGWSNLDFPAGSVVDVAAWNTFDARQEPHMPDALQASIGAMGNLGPVRTHDFIKTNPGSYGITKLLWWMGDVIRAVQSMTSQLWLQTEWHLSDAEEAAFAEYIATPWVSAEATPWAHIRYLQGQTAPWFDAFDEIWFEKGNENWNWSGGFYPLFGSSGVSGGIMSAGFADRCATIWEANPDWDTDKAVYALGGRNPRNGSWVTDVANNSSKGHIITINDYTDGIDVSAQGLVDPSNPDDWTNLAIDSEHLNRRKWSGDLLTLAEANGMKAAGYEQGGGWYLAQTLTVEERAKENEIMKSVLSGTTIMSMWCINACQGLTEQQLFLFGAGQTWSTHSLAKDGGKPNIHYMWTCMFWNAHFAGATMTEIDLMIEPTDDIVTADHNVPDCKLVNAFRADNGGKTYIVLANTDLTADHDVRINVPPKAPVVRHYLDISGPWAGGDFEYKAHNNTFDTKDDVILSSETVVGNTSPLLVTIKRGQCEVYEFG